MQAKTYGYVLLGLVLGGGAIGVIFVKRGASWGHAQQPVAQRDAHGLEEKPTPALKRVTAAKAAPEPAEPASAVQAELRQAIADQQEKLRSAEAVMRADETEKMRLSHELAGAQAEARNRGEELAIAKSSLDAALRQANEMRETLAKQSRESATDAERLADVRKRTITISP